MSLIFVRKRLSDCLGCAVLLCLVCLNLLASFFLPSLKHIYMYMYMYMHAVMFCTCTVCTFILCYMQYTCTCTSTCSFYLDVYVHVHVHTVTALGVLCCFALFVCLTLLASFFLPSHLSFKNMYVFDNNYVH